MASMDVPTDPPAPDAAPTPPDEVPKNKRNAWIWVSAGLGLVAVGLLIWALTLRSDVDSTKGELDSAKQELASTEEELATAQKELGSTKQELDTAAQQLDDATQAASAPPAASEEEDQSKGGTAGLVAAGALVTGLARELGATQEDVAETEQELADAEKQADAAEQEAAAAERLADDATDEADKADAQVTQANAERDAAQAKARIAAECGKAYISRSESCSGAVTSASRSRPFARTSKASRPTAGRPSPGRRSVSDDGVGGATITFQRRAVRRCARLRLTGVSVSAASMTTVPARWSCSPRRRSSKSTMK